MSVQSRPINTDEAQAEWLHQTLQALPPDRFHLVGLSIGAGPRSTSRCTDRSTSRR